MFLIVSCALFLGSLVFAEISCPDRVKFDVAPKYLRIYGHWCYFFNIYGKKTYGQARAQCQLLGGSLAMPKTEAVNDFLVEKLKVTYYHIKPIWIGMNDKVAEGTFVWEDGSFPQWNNFNFKVGHWFPHLENCVALDPITEDWDDFDCEQDYFHVTAKKGYICQFLATVPGTGHQSDVNKSYDGGDNDERSEMPKADKKEPHDIDNDEDPDKRKHGNASRPDAQHKIMDTGILKSDDQDTEKEEERQGNLTSTSHGSGDLEDSTCPLFVCPALDCGMKGFRYNNRGCQLCECNN